MNVVRGVSLTCLGQRLEAMEEICDDYFDLSLPLDGLSIPARVNSEVMHFLYSSLPECCTSNAEVRKKFRDFRKAHKRYLETVDVLVASSSTILDSAASELGLLGTSDSHISIGFGYFLLKEQGKLLDHAEGFEKIAKKLDGLRDGTPAIVRTQESLVKELGRLFTRLMSDAYTDEEWKELVDRHNSDCEVNPHPAQDQGDSRISFVARVLKYYSDSDLPNSKHIPAAPRFSHSEIEKVLGKEFVPDWSA